MHAGTFLRLRFAGDLGDSKSTSGGILCVCGSHTFLPISSMCEDSPAVLSRKNFAKITDVFASGPLARNHNSSNMADGQSAARKTTCRSTSLLYRPVLSFQLHLHLQHQYCRKQWFPHCIPHQQEVRVREAQCR